MARQSIYTVGGTVQAGGGVYIKRKADDELLELCREGELGFVLSSRQVGKSSLMERTAEQLEKENIRSAKIDLSGIGTNVTQDEWYLGIMNIIATDLNLETDIFSWWSRYAGLGPPQRFYNFLRDVVMKEVTTSVVLFFDEIDSTLSISFSDDFFASLRAVYNARSNKPDFKRLSFVLVGVATPSDLISDSKRTPFNIGRRVDLEDFTLEDAIPLAKELGENSEHVLKWILEWSGGHPYLTQRLCVELSKNNDVVDRQIVTQAAESLFIGERGRQDTNLQFVRDMLTKRAPDIHRVLRIYRDVRSGKKVTDDERSIPKAHLKISGVVRRVDGQLQPRNRIYENAFDLTWIKENTPPTTTRRLAIALSFVTVIALMMAGYFAWQEWNRTDAERAASMVADFEMPNVTGQTRLKSLVGLYELSDGYALQAYRLFHNLTMREQIELFSDSRGWGVRRNQIFAAENFYPFMDDTEDDNMVLLSMSEILRDSKQELSYEIDAWVAGRKAIRQGNFEEAEEILSNVIRANTTTPNPGLYYDRARAYMGIGTVYYPNALKDLQEVVLLSPWNAAKIRRLLESDDAMQQHWEAYQDDFDALKKAIFTSEVFVPAGEFLMGTDDDPSTSKDESPIHTVYLDSFYIDAYEVTNGMYIECVFDGVCSLPKLFSPFGGQSYEDTYFGNSKYEDHPVIHINWFDAVTYCEWRGARLPTEAEWEKAARGMDGRTYPWGEELDDTFANFNNAIGTTPVGSYEKGKSPYGAYDMAGNVWEWVADWYSESYYEDSSFSNPTGPNSGESRVVRGGGWGVGDYLYLGDIRTTERDSGNPTSTFYGRGFRCARGASE